MDRKRHVFPYPVLPWIRMAALLILVTVIPSFSGASSDLPRFDHPFKSDLELSGIMQDRDGFFWIATDKALYKYDGRNLTLFDTGLRGTHHIPFEDREGNLWIPTYSSGVVRYSKTTFTFTRFSHDSPVHYRLSSDRTDGIYQIIVQDHDGYIWIGTKQGLDRLDPETGLVRSFHHADDNPHSISDDDVLCLLVDRHSTIWAGTRNGGLNRFDPETETFTTYMSNSRDPSSISGNWIISLFEDHEGTLWIGTEKNGLNRFRPEENAFDRFVHDSDNPDSLGENRIKYISEDGFHNLWITHGIARSTGVTRLDRMRKAFTRFTPDPENPFAIRSFYIQMVYPDDCGILWFVAGTGEIDTINPLSNQFGLLQNNPKDPNSLSFNPVIGICEDNNRIMWFGSGSGLNRFDPQTGRFTRFLNTPSDDTAIPHPFVPGICEDRSGRFWIGSFDGILSLFDRDSGRCIRHFVHDPGDFETISSNKQVRFILQDRDDPGILWVATYEGGLNRFDITSGTFKRYLASPDTPHTVMDNSAPTLFDDGRGYLWIPNRSGLDRLDKSTGLFTHLVHDPNNPDAIGPGNINEVIQDMSGRYWVGGTGSGLQEMDPATLTFRRHDETTGFPTSDIRSILEDSRGNLWLGSNIGIIRFDPDTLRTKVFTEKDGLQGNLFFQTARCKSRDGTLWFGGMNGVSYFHPDRIKSNQAVPPVFFTRLTQAGDPIELNRAVEKTTEIHLDWKQNFFEFEFAALDYVRPEKNQYAYMLEGHDKDWYFAGAHPFGRYANLKGGIYRLRVKGSNNDGLWNETGASLRIVVAQPFWKTLWFKLLALLSVVGFTAWRLLDLKKQKTVLEQKVRHRTAQIKSAMDAAERAMETAEKASSAKSIFLANISHELRTPLNSILGYSQMMLKQGRLEDSTLEKLEVIHQSGNHLLLLINDILDITKIEAGKMALNPSAILVKNFLDNIVRIADSWADSKGIVIHYSAAADLPESIMADEVRLRQVLINLLNNAVKFTQKGRIDFTITRAVPDDTGESSGRACIRFEVKDTGIGMSPDECRSIFLPFEQVRKSGEQVEGTGLGLSISRQLVSMMGGELKVESEPEKGSTFWFEAWFPTHLETPLTSEPDVDMISGYHWEHDRRCRVLIVDDNPVNQSIISHQLYPLGFQIFQAQNGQQAIEKCIENKPDLILMDISMPEMDGIEAAGIIRTFRELKSVVIIGLSATGDESAFSDLAEKGFNAFANKPIDSRLLLQKIEAHMGLSWTFHPPSGPVSVLSDWHRITPPPDDILDTLGDLVRRGNIKKIIELAEIIKITCPQCDAFASSVKILATRFDEKKLMEMMAHYSGDFS